jgi:hypothetical protein
MGGGIALISVGRLYNRTGRLISIHCEKHGFPGFFPSGTGNAWYSMSTWFHSRGGLALFPVAPPALDLSGT